MEKQFDPKEDATTVSKEIETGLAVDTRKAILQRRSIRKFQQTPVSHDILTDLVDMARMHASGNNLQPVRYAIISQEPMRNRIFPLLRWAGYLPDFKIAPDEQPAAYLILLKDTRIRKECGFDIGAAATTIMLMAETYGLGTCCIGSFAPGPLTELLGLEPELKPELVIALGYPAQKSRAVPCRDGNIRYSEAADGSLEVPKRTLDEVLVYADA